MKIKGYKLFIGYVLARYAQCDGQVITGGNISIAQVCVSFWLTAAAPDLSLARMELSYIGLRSEQWFKKN